ncbi:hypothetical protein GC176_10925 [bacterium]|nr:hypothetical protein [bacterium]
MTLVEPVLFVWVLFVAYSFCHAPIPGVNEPHYLCKAKHYWEPEWCRGDFFLESSNPHLVFYQTIGWLTHVFQFHDSASLGRYVALLLLAAGLTRLCRALSGDGWSSVTAAVTFLLLQSIGNFSGEWIVGGVEGKVVAYGCVLHCLTECLQRRWAFAGPWLGAAIAFHPLVGLWTLMALGMTAVAGWLLRRPGRSSEAVNEQSISLIRLSELKSESFLIGAVLMSCLAAWGILPALDTMRGATERETFAATYLQVFFRLKHHVDPMEFPPSHYVMYGGLSFIAWLLSRLRPRTPGRATLNRLVFCAGIIAACGVAIGFGKRPPTEMPYYEIRMKLLKFYPFRLFDALLPLLVALQVASLLSRQRLTSVLVPRKLRAVGLAATYVTALLLNAGWGSVHRLNPQQEADWRSACDWIRQNTPRDVLFLTPDESWAFKWFAQRPEYVARKDCPQDAAGIIEWNRRLNFIQKWGQENLTPNGYTARQAQTLSDETGITHILSRRFGPFDLPVVYQNETYRVYGIPIETASRSRH